MIISPCDALILSPSVEKKNDVAEEGLDETESSSTSSCESVSSTSEEGENDYFDLSVINDRNNDVTVNNDKTRRKSVKFSQVQVREFGIILGDNPSVTNGPPITLDWDVQEMYSYDVDSNEEPSSEETSESSSASPDGETKVQEIPYHLRENRQSEYSLRTTEAYRTRLLLNDPDNCYTIEDIKQAAIIARNEKYERDLSYAWSNMKDVEMKLQMAVKKVQRCCRWRRKPARGSAEAWLLEKKAQQKQEKKRAIRVLEKKVDR